MLKLYGSGASRWVKPYWLLKEMKLDFHPKAVKMSTGEHRHPDFLKINPYGKVPVLEDGDLVLTESSAICTYLADLHPQQGFIPKAGSQNRALYNQWISIIITELEQPLWRMIKHRYIYPEAKRSAAEIELACEDFGHVVAVLEKQIKGPYLVGNQFSVADIAMTYTLIWAGMGTMPPGLLDKSPGLRSYRDKHRQREHFPHELYPEA